MAQPQKPNNVKKRDSFFKRELKNHRISGPINFLEGKNTNQRYKVCKSICMDIVCGVLNPEEEYAYFSLPLLDELITFTYSKWFQNNTVAGCISTNYTAMLNMYGGAGVNERIMALCGHYRRAADAYSVLYQCFNAMRTDGNVIGWLTTAMGQLGGGKYSQNI